MGLHRSGTSILYKMLGETKKFSILTLYHVIYYNELIYNHVNKIETRKKQELNNLIIKRGIKTRKTDHMTVNADYPHEYMYIFSEQGYTWKINEKNKVLFETLCKKLKYISENNNPILLKNPHDFANFVFIKQNFPNAKFIFIHRNPFEVINSNMRLWETHLKKRNEFLAMYLKSYGKLYDNPLSRILWRLIYISKIPIGITRVVNLAAKRTKGYLKDISYLKNGDYIILTYEDLCRKPNKTIGKILDFLNVKSDIDFSKLIKPRDLKLMPKVEFWKKLISKKMKDYISYLHKISNL